MELTNEDSGCDVVGRASIQDNDLLDAYIALRQDVPSVVSFLEELQYLRDLTKLQNKKLDVFYLALDNLSTDIQHFEAVNVLNVGKNHDHK